MDDFRIFSKNSIFTLGLWTLFTFHLANLIHKMSGLERDYSLLLAIPPMIFMLLMIFSIGFVMIATPTSTSRVKFGLKIIIFTVISQMLFMSAIFMTSRILDSISGNDSEFFFSSLKRVKSGIAGMGWIYSFIGVMRGFLLFSIKKERLAEKKSAEQLQATYEAELKSVKSMINPHFLFNSLNVISTLTVKKPKIARETCIQLSDFMRYSLQLADIKFATVKQETEHIRNYLEIEKIRYGKKLQYNIEIEDNLCDIKVPALMLLPLVENSVKYGVQQSVEESTINLSINKKNNKLIINVSNPLRKTDVKKKGEGMGLKILKRQIDSVYGDKAEIIITRNDNFIVELRLPLGEFNEKE